MYSYVRLSERHNAYVVQGKRKYLCRLADPMPRMASWNANLHGGRDRLNGGECEEDGTKNIRMDRYRSRADGCSWRVSTVK
jgi:hypothetical protein